MATIKTIVDEAGVRRVITKLVDEERKVSCACCTPTVCCMYPADQLGVGYTEDDLPDTIDVEGLVLGVPTRIIVPRNGSQYGPFNQSTSGGATFTDTLLVDLNVFGNLAWLFNEDAIGDPCLFLADNSEEYVVEDTYEDAYQITGPVSGTVTRQSRCLWSGTGLTLSNYGYQWTVNGRSKSGDQNTPVGSYADGYSVSA
jgi:hypothetical protein